MYFIGMGFYVSAMVDDLAAALDDFDKSRHDPTTIEMARMSRKQALAGIFCICQTASVNSIREFLGISLCWCSLASVSSDNTTDVIFYQMLFSAVILRTFLFAIDETKGMNTSNVTALVGTSTVLLPTFLFCMLSQNVTVRIADIDAMRSYDALGIT